MSSDRLTATGRIVRLAVVGAWLAMFAFHVLRHALPGLGLVRRQDISQMLERDLDRTRVYGLFWSIPGRKPRSVGSGEIACGRDDNRFRIDSSVHLDDILSLAGTFRLAHVHRNRMAADLRSTLELDDHCLVVSFDASGQIARWRGRVKAIVDAAGCHARYELGAGPWMQFDLPGLGQRTFQFADLAMDLPAGLRTGDRFVEPVLGFDQMNPKPVRELAVFTVTAEVPMVISGTSLNCLEVHMAVDDHPAAELWCDRAGTVYRSRSLVLPLVIDLVRISTADGTEVWPGPLHAPRPDVRARP